jgi:hypothetical protein
MICIPAVYPVAPEWPYRQGNPLVIRGKGQKIDDIIYIYSILLDSGVTGLAD